MEHPIRLRSRLVCPYAERIMVSGKGELTIFRSEMFWEFLCRCYSEHIERNENDNNFSRVILELFSVSVEGIYMFASRSRAKQFTPYL